MKKYEQITIKAARVLADSLLYVAHKQKIDSVTSCGGIPHGMEALNMSAMSAFSKLNSKQLRDIADAAVEAEKDQELWRRINEFEAQARVKVPEDLLYSTANAMLVMLQDLRKGEHNLHGYETQFTLQDIEDAWRSMADTVMFGK
jgi:hypothetical protein